MFAFLDGYIEDLTPRKRIVSVAYALRSNDADALGGQPASAFMPAATDNWVNTTGVPTPGQYWCIQDSVPYPGNN